jgi:hypothetical protein
VLQAEEEQVAHPIQASTQVAEKAFGFLVQLGFTLVERWVTGGESFRDGWRLSYSSPEVCVTVQYLDAQFEVHFTKSGTSASYLAIDRDLFDRRSGFHGDMFPPQKLEAAMERIAGDIREYYETILFGNEGEWTRIARLQNKEPQTSRLPD